jgi:hypothetical protein
MPTAREQWFADVLQAGLDTRVLSEQDILSHATPAVLTAALPRDVMVRVIDATLAAGTMSHKMIIEVVTIALLAEKVPPAIVWGALAAAVERGGIRDGIPKDEAAARELMRRALSSALETGFLTPKDLIGHVNAQVLGASLPEALTAKLLEATLAAGKMNPEIIVDTLGVDAITKYVSTKAVWSAFVKPGEQPATGVAAAVAAASAAPVARQPGMAAGSGPAPKLEFVDDDAGNVEVEVEGFEPDPKPAAAAAAAAKAAAAMAPVGKQPSR